MNLVDDFTTFLAKRPSNEEIVNWRPSTRVQKRISDLLYRQNAGKIDAAEKEEIEGIAQAELMLRQVKAKLQLAMMKKRA